MNDKNNPEHNLSEDSKQRQLDESAGNMSDTNYELSDGEVTYLTDDVSYTNYELSDGEVTYLVDEATDYYPWPRQSKEKNPS